MARVEAGNKDMKGFCKDVANTLAHCERRIEQLVAMIKADGYEEMPEDVRVTVEKEVHVLDALFHLAIGAFNEGFISLETAMLEISAEYGSRGASKLEKILQQHSKCWADIRATAPGGEWSAEKGFQAAQQAQERKEEPLRAVHELAAKLLGIPVEEIKDAAEMVELVKTVPEAVVRDAFGHACVALAATSRKAEPELSGLVQKLHGGNAAALPFALAKQLLKKAKPL